jgi:uncharacterized protein (TIGR02246 family)
MSEATRSSPRKPSTPEQVSIDFARAVSDGDLDGAASLFAEDACFLMADGQEVRGRANIRAILEPLLANRPAMEVEIDRMIVVGGTAVGSERWRMSFAEADGSAFEQSGTSTVVMRRSAEQGWQLCVDAPWGFGVVSDEDGQQT